MSQGSSCGGSSPSLPPPTPDRGPRVFTTPRGHLFARAAGANDHKLSGLKCHRFIIYRSEGQTSRWSKIKMPAGLCSLWWLYFLISTGLLCSLAPDRLPSSSKPARVVSSLLSVLCFCLHIPFSHSEPPASLLYEDPCDWTHLDDLK